MSAEPTAEEWRAFLADLADLGDPLALERFRAGDLRVETKPDTSLVTEADLAIEERLRSETGRRHPELAIGGEEHGQQDDTGAGRLWIDPIDATANFARGIPIFATLLAIERRGEIVAGMVSAPALGTRWSAALGAGAWRDNRRIRVSGISDLAHAQAFHGSVGGFEGQALPPGHRAVLEQTRRQRGFGDFYQHVLVAEGAGELAIDPIVNPWDIAPLLVLVAEAGGNATSLDGECTLFGNSLVSTNGLLHRQVLARLGEPGA